MYTSLSILYIYVYTYIYIYIYIYVYIYIYILEEWVRWDANSTAPRTHTCFQYSKQAITQRDNT